LVHIHNYKIFGSFYNFRFPAFFHVLCFVKVKLSVKVKLFVPLLCVCAILPAMVVPRNDLHCVGRDVKPYSLTHFCSSDFSIGVFSALVSDFFYNSLRLFVV